MIEPMGEGTPETTEGAYEVRRDCLFGPGLDVDEGFEIDACVSDKDFEDLAHDIYSAGRSSADALLVAENAELKRKGGELCHAWGIALLEVPALLEWLKKYNAEKGSVFEKFKDSFDPAALTNNERW